MKHSKKIVGQLSKSLRTPAGPKPSDSTQKETKQPSTISQQQAINTAFYKIKLAFPLTYQKAYPSLEKEQHAKSVWLEQLIGYQPKRIMAACNQAIHQSYYFVDLSQILKYCRNHYADLGLPTPQGAYQEACLGYKTVAQFSHIAIFLAARETGWYLLRNEPQSVTFPLFKQHYETLFYRIRSGEDIAHDLSQPALKDERRKTALEKSEQINVAAQQARMQTLQIDPKGGRAVFLHARKQQRTS